MSTSVKESNSSDETKDLASEFARSLPKGSVVGLVGPLGAGKTLFVQGMAMGLGIDPDRYVTSPTFTLLNEYQSLLFHFDLYRISSFKELEETGFEEFISKGGISVIEWADRFPELAKLLTHTIEIEITGDTTRRIGFTYYSPQSPSLFESTQ